MHTDLQVDLYSMVSAQTFAERLFARLQRGGGERFETRLAITALVSRVVGVHRLLLLNFYPFLQKYLQPHQRDVTQLLAALVQARYIPNALILPPTYSTPDPFSPPDLCMHRAAAPGVL